MRRQSFRVSRTMKHRPAHLPPWGLLAAALVLGALGGGTAVWLSTRSCAPGEPTPTPPDPLGPATAFAWTEPPPPAFPLPPYARFLADVKIVLDPGHVGQRDPGGTWKRGPTGLREAEVNLRVAQFLREFLECAGAIVYLTREVDEPLDLPDDEDLRQRVTLANQLRADLLVSIHHNGVDNPAVNYTTVFYHGDGTDQPAARCAARHLLAGLDETLRLATQLECALRSDHDIYPNRGFAVLRLAEVPAVLTEASFHSHPEEEARLRDPVYNRREAYGLFLGLARWAQAGLPRVRLLGDGPVRAGDEVHVALDDGLGARGGWGAEQLRLAPDSLVARLDGRAVPCRLDAARRRAVITIPRQSRGTAVLFVDFQNVFGQHVLHPALPLGIRPR